MKRTVVILAILSLALAPMAMAQEAPSPARSMPVDVQVFPVQVQGQQNAFCIVSKHRGGLMGAGLFGNNVVSMAFGFIGADGAIHSFGDPVMAASKGTVQNILEGTAPVMVGGVWYYLGQTQRAVNNVNQSVNANNNNAQTQGQAAIAAQAQGQGQFQGQAQLQGQAQGQAQAQQATGGFVPPGQQP